MSRDVKATDCLSDAELQTALESEFVDPDIEHHIETCSTCQVRLAAQCDAHHLSACRSVLSDSPRPDHIDIPRQPPSTVDERGAAPTTNVVNCSVIHRAPVEQSPTDQGVVQGDPGVSKRIDDANLPSIPGYVLHREMGRGGMGVIYQATDVELGRPVAIKMLLAGALAGPERMARFQFEARACARLTHENIVAIYEIGEAAGLPYLALEMIQGPNLAEYIQGKPQAAAMAARLTRQLAKAVDVAHRQGVVHRDIKPANILIHRSDADSSLVPKLTDFGLAKQADAEPYTRTVQILGTPGYLAPERLQGGSVAGEPAVDIYALGCVLYELLTGQPPFHGESPEEILRRSQIAGPRRPRLLQPNVPPDLETICLKCLQTEPKDRYPTARALADDLERWLNGQPIWAQRRNALSHVWMWAKRKPAIATLSTGILVAVVALSVQWVLSARRSVRELARTRSALRNYLVNVRDDPRLQVADLAPLRATLLEEALTLYDEAIADHADAELLVDRADVLVQLGQLRNKLGDHAAAGRHFYNAVEAFERNYALRPATDEPDNGLWQLAQGQGNLTAFLLQEEQLEEALQSASKNIPRYKALLAAAPENPQYRWALGGGNRRVAAIQSKLNRTDEAIQSFRNAVEALEPLPPVGDYMLELSRAYRGLANALVVQGEFEGAERQLISANTTMLNVLSENRLERYRAEFGSVLRDWSFVLDKAGKTDQAIIKLKQAISIQRYLSDSFASEPQYAVGVSLLQQRLAEHGVTHTPSDLTTNSGPTLELLNRSEVALLEIFQLLVELDYDTGQQRLEKVERDLRMGLNDCPDNPNLRNLLAHCLERLARLHFDQGKTTRAQAVWSEWDRFRTTWQVSQTALASKALASGRTSESTSRSTDLLGLIEGRPRNARVMCLVGRAFAERLSGKLSAPENDQLRKQLDTLDHIRRSVDGYGLIHKRVLGIQMAEFYCSLAILANDAAGESGHTHRYIRAAKECLDVYRESNDGASTEALVRLRQRASLKLVDD